MSICPIASGELLPPRPRLLPPDDVQTPVVEDETEDRDRWQWKNPWLFYGYEILPGYVGDYIPSLFNQNLRESPKPNK